MKRSRTAVLCSALALAGVAGWLAPALSQPAPVKLPDSAAQRQRMIVELEQANRQLAQIVKLLTQIRDQRAAEARGG